MIVLMVIGSITIYLLIAKFAINKVYEKTQNIKYKRIAIAFFILLPTWDVIVGYPVYKYYCYTESGERIYKTVDNVDGVYVGTCKKEYDPVEPLCAYKYVDYKEKESGKYFRSYWLDNNVSKLCVPVGVYRYSPYAKSVAQGKCIAKQEIPFKQISRYGFPSIYGDDDTYINGFPALKSEEEYTKVLWIKWGKPSELVVPILGISKIHETFIYDRLNKSFLQERTYFTWNKGFVLSRLPSLSTGCPDVLSNSGEFKNTSLENILKPSKVGVNQ